MAVRVSLAAANIAGIGQIAPLVAQLAFSFRHRPGDVFDPRHIEEYVRGDLPGLGEVPSMVRKVAHKKRRADELVGLLHYAWDRNLELVSELVRLTHEKELHSAVLAALNVSTNVAEEAEGEPGPHGPTPAEEIFFPFAPGVVHAAPLKGSKILQSCYGTILSVSSTDDLLLPGMLSPTRVDQAGRGLATTTTAADYDVLTARAAVLRSAKRG